MMFSAQQDVSVMKFKRKNMPQWFRSTFSFWVKTDKENGIYLPNV